MHLTPHGVHAGQLGTFAKTALANQLILGQKNVREYTNGICYDTVAFVRYLMTAKISPTELVARDGNAWKDRFRFEGGTKWDGKTDIMKGTAVGFFRIVDSTVFHAGVAIGGKKVRGVNGGRLGAEWLHPVDLSQVLGKCDPKREFTWDRTQIRVCLSTSL